MKRIERIIKRSYLRLLYRISPEKYKEQYPFFLKKLGVNISDDYRIGGHGFIHPTVFFDGNDFSLITIGENTTISANVILLTHDYSITKGLQSIGISESARFLKPISIGANSFLGMNTIVLPGCSIGKNVIVGAGSVVSKDVPDNVVIAGNPAKIISSTEEWTKRHMKKEDYYVL